MAYGRRARHRVLTARRRAANAVLDVRSSAARTRLLQRHADQHARWHELRRGFARDADDGGGEPAPAWRDFAGSLRAELLPLPPYRFLRLPTVMATLVAHGSGRRRAQLAYLRERLEHEQLVALLEEDPAGGPVLSEPSFLTSTTRIQQAHHLVRFRDATGAGAAAVDPIVEWGGGFGGTARVARRLWPDATIVIVDLPLLSALQHLYLATVLGPEAVVLHRGPGQPLAPGIANLVPAPHLQAESLRAGLFLSTWALSESLPETQAQLAGSGFLGARHLLLAFQRSNRLFPDAGRLGDLARDAGATLEPLNGAPGSTYAFR